MDRQFTEEEAREIFARAAERQHAVGAGPAGLSIADLREIGREAGLDPEHVEAAARSVALGEPEHGRLSSGPLPRGVYRTAYLPGPPTDALWERVVGDARRTFSAQGKTSEGGAVREWRNSNLRITLEPAGDGSRLHLQTRRDDRVMSTAIFAAVALFALATFAVSGFDLAGEGSVGVMAVAAALGALGFGADQRRWAAERERQFAEVARRATEAAGPAGLDATATRAEGLDAAPGTQAAEGEGLEAPARIDPGLLDADAEGGAAGGRERRRVR